MAIISSQSRNSFSCYSMVWKFSVWLFLLTVSLANSQRLNEDDDQCQTPKGEQGTCISIQVCKPILDILKNSPKPISPEIRALLKSYQCGFEGKNPKVCCVREPPIFNEPPDVTNHQNINLLPKNCGYLDTDDRIVYGNKTKLFEFPWMALLSYSGKRGPEFKCGGTVINRRYILTAAHCITNISFKLLGVRVGEYDIRTQIDCETDKEGQETCAPKYRDVAIEKVIPHPQYAPKAMINDIGLLRVSPINLSLENIKAVCLPLDGTRNYNFTGRNIVVTGWGATESGGSSPVLLKAELPVVPLEKCIEQYQKVIAVTDRQLCAGGNSKSDSCAGDSGGPLHALGSLYGELRYIQQGVVSFGPRKCGEESLPGVYTKVASYMDWILDNIKP